jgi:hypothetical protein
VEQLAAVEFAHTTHLVSLAVTVYCDEAPEVVGKFWAALPCPLAFGRLAMWHGAACRGLRPLPVPACAKILGDF